MFHRASYNPAAGIDNIRIVTSSREGFRGNQAVWDHTKGPFNVHMFTQRYRQGLVQDPLRKDFESQVKLFPLMFQGPESCGYDLYLP